jgi:deazaflavin-dependent oxidoreductase (nitroreductase family)
MRFAVALAGLITAHLLVIAGIVGIVRLTPGLGYEILKRYNAVVLPTAGRRFSPYSVLRHTGRRSGRTYFTPVGAYQFKNGFVMGLTYGPTVDWCRNVMASRDAVIRWRGHDYSLERPEVTPIDPQVLRAFPRLFRPVLAKQLSHCLWMARVATSPG